MFCIKINKQNTKHEDQIRGRKIEPEEIVFS